MDVNSIVVEAAAQSRGPASSSSKRVHSDEVKQLFDARRMEQDPVLRKQLSKDLWRALRRQRRLRHDAEITEIADRGQGLRSLQQVLGRQSGTERIAQVWEKAGSLVSDGVSIAEVFVTFYEELYKCDAAAREGGEDNLTELICPVTASEITAALKRMRNKRTGADDGLVAEMLKAASEDLVEVVAECFTDILSGSMDPPADWKVARLSILFKKGDANQPKNYRPISIIPVMAKLYSIVLYNRMRDTLDGQFTEEQFGFRQGRVCDDVNHILRLGVEKSNEWGEDLWMAAPDVEKVFDKAFHDELFDALLDGGVDLSIVALLRKLYRGMEAYVQLWPGVESRHFEIQRGVRQGDPLSSVLFNLVMTGILKQVDAIWQRRGH